MYYWLLKNAEPRFAQDWADEINNKNELLCHFKPNTVAPNLARIMGKIVDCDTGQVTKREWYNVYNRFDNYLGQELRNSVLSDDFIWFEGEERPIRF